MKEPKKTLLDLDHTPTLEELRTFFKENDWSTAAYIDLNDVNLPIEALETVGHAKKTDRRALGAAFS